MQKSYNVFEAFDLMKNDRKIKMCYETHDGTHIEYVDVYLKRKFFDEDDDDSTIVIASNLRDINEVYPIAKLKKLCFFIKEENGYWKKVDNQEETINCIMNNDKMKIYGEVYEKYVNTDLLKSIFSINNMYREYVNNDIEYWVNEN